MIACNKVTLQNRFANYKKSEERWLFACCLLSGVKYFKNFVLILKIEFIIEKYIISIIRKNKIIFKYLQNSIFYC